MVGEEKSCLERSLLLVAQDLQRLSRIRQSKLEFEREMAEAPSRPVLIKPSTTETAAAASQQCDLEMLCESDSTYDVDEVRYQNFLARNRITSRSNVIKTLVYRVPESAYVVKKTQVIIEEDPSKIVSLPPPQVIKSPEPVAKKEALTQVKTKKHPTPSKEKKDVKYTAEDMIVIDDDDDILGVWSSEEEKEPSSVSESIDEAATEPKQGKKAATASSFSDSEADQSNLMSEESDVSDADVEEEDTSDSDRSFSPKRHSLRTSGSQAKKRKFSKRTGSGTRGRPRVVIDRAIEPISSIRINNDPPAEAASSKRTRSRPNQLAVSASVTKKASETEAVVAGRNLRVTRSRSSLAH